MPDETAVTTGVSYSLISFGADISTWSGTNDAPNCHIYYNILSGIKVDLLATDKRNSSVSHAMGTNVLIKLDSTGLYIDNTLFTTSSSADSAFMAYINSLTSIQIGSIEGNNRSGATYNYIKVVKAS